MKRFKIKNTSGEIIFSAECVSLGACVELAVQQSISLSGADLSGAVLPRANLFGVNLAGVNLTGANLAGANLAGANLSGANLSGANLHHANLSGANLADTNLHYADLFGANLAGADLTGAKYGKEVPLECTPLMLQGTKYDIIIMDRHIKIGCKLYSHTEWESFSTEQIAQMDDGALTWWKAWKMTVLNLSRLHQQHIADS